MTILLRLVEILSPVFLSALAGWLWVRSGRSFDRKLIGDLIVSIGAPCLIFSSLTSLEVSPGAMLEMAGTAVLAYGLFSVASALALRVAGLPRHTFMAPLVFGNNGNMGVPLCFFAFGGEGQALALVFFAIGASLQFSLGLLIWSGHFDPRELLRNPVGLAALLAAATIALDVPVPALVLNTTELLGSFAIPLMLLALGAAMAELAVVDLPRSLALGLLRLALGLSIGFGLSAALGLDGIARGVLVLQCAMPPAVFNYLLAQRYERSPEQVASVVVVSTLMAAGVLVVLLPLLI